MKLLIYGDVHWSEMSSLINMRQHKFTTRLELLIKSMNWVNQLAVEQQCEATVCDGDFFHRSTVTDEESTALKEIYWADVTHYFLVGNHESGQKNLFFKTTDLLAGDNRFVISEPFWNWTIDGTQIHFLPYIVDDIRKPLEDYLDKDVDENGNELKHVVISHNDIAGIMYGGFESTLGFSVEEIEKNCDLFLNGHLHNSEWISDKILNIGSLSAHNFTNDSYHYKYGAWILDTDTLKLTFFENPYSLSVYKIDILEAEDLNKLRQLKPNAMISIRCTDGLLNDVNAIITELKTSGNVLASKLSIIHENTESAELPITELTGLDHLAKLTEFCQAKLGVSQVLSEELAEISK